MFGKPYGVLCCHCLISWRTGTAVCLHSDIDLLEFYLVYLSLCLSKTLGFSGKIIDY